MMESLLRGWEEKESRAFQDVSAERGIFKFSSKKRSFCKSEKVKKDKIGQITSLMCIERRHRFIFEETRSCN